MGVVVKMMSNENIPDDDSRKQHTLYVGVEYVSFYRSSDGKPMALLTIDGEDITLDLDLCQFGNCYVMNENGKTISSFCSSKYVKS